MKKIKPLLFLIVLLTLTASQCGDKIRFANPQPEKVANSEEIDKKIQGKFLFIQRNYEPEDPYFPKPAQFFDTLSALLEIDIAYHDSLTLTFSEHQVVEESKQEIFIEKLPFEHLLRQGFYLIAENPIRRLASTELFRRIFGEDSIFVESNFIFFVDSTYIEFYKRDNSACFIEDKDTTIQISFSQDFTQGIISMDGQTYEIAIVDSEMFISEQLNLREDICYSDSMLQAAEDRRFEARLFYDEGAMHIHTKRDTLIATIIDNIVSIKINHSLATIFDQASGDILKRYKKAYYLNNPENLEDSVFWKVSQIILQKDDLTYSVIDDTTSLNILSDITGNSRIYETNDRVYHIFDPSKREFGKFIKSNGFIKKSFYRRIE